MLLRLDAARESVFFQRVQTLAVGVSARVTIVQELMEEYEELREEHYAGQEERHYLTFEKAQSKGMKIDFTKRPPAPAPLKPGITVVTEDYGLSDVLDYIDWNPFFQVCYYIPGIYIVFPMSGRGERRSFCYVPWTNVFPS